MSLLKLFCHIDDFYQDFEKGWKNELLTSALRQHQRSNQLSRSEMLAIMVYFHQSQYRHFYLACKKWQNRESNYDD